MLLAINFMNLLNGVVGVDGARFTRLISNFVRR